MRINLVQLTKIGFNPSDILLQHRIMMRVLGHSTPNKALADSGGVNTTRDSPAIK